MGEMTFRYDVKNKHRLVHSLRYWFNKTTEYGFAYQRFVALYDTRIFDSPVVITKVATGLPYILGPFVYPRQSFDMEMLNGFNVLKDGKSTEDPLKYAPFFIEKDGKSFIVWDDILVSPRDVNHAIENDMLDVYYARPFGIYGNWCAAPKEKILSENETFLVSPDVTSVGAYENLLGEYSIPAGGIYRSDMSERPRLGVNFDDEATGTPYDSTTSIFQDYHGRGHVNTLNVSEDELGRPYDNIGNIGKTVLGKPDDLMLNHIPLFNTKRINDDKLVKEKLISATPEQRMGQDGRWFFLEKEQYESLVAASGLHANIIIPRIQYLGAEDSLYRENYVIEENVAHGIHKTIYDLEVNKVHGAFRQNPYVHYEHYLLHGRAEGRSVVYDYYVRHGKAEDKYAIRNKDLSAYGHLKTGIAHADIYAHKDGPLAHESNPLLAFTTAGKTSAIAQSLWSDKYTKEGTYYLSAFASRDVTRGEYMASDLFVGQVGIKSYVNQSFFGSKDGAIADAHDNALGFSMERKYASVTQKDVYVSRKHTDVRLHVQTWAAGGGIGIALYSGRHQAYRDRTSSELYAMTFMRKNAWSMSISDGLMTYKTPVNISISPAIHMAREINHLHRQDMFDGVYKIKYGIDVGDPIGVHRTIAGISRDDWIVHAHNTVDGVLTQSSMEHGTKDVSQISPQDVITVHLEQRYASYYNVAMSLLKGAVSVQNTSALDGVIKAIWHVRLNNFGTSYNGLIIPVTKSYTDVSAFNNDIGAFAHKLGKEAFFTENDMASVLRKPSFLSGLNYLNAEKMYHDVMMGVYNYYAEKATVRAFVQQGDWFYHSPRHAFVTQPVSQTFKDAFLSGHFDNEMWGVKDAYHGIVYEQIMTDTHKLAFDTATYNAEFGEKGRYGLYYFYDVLSERTKQEMNVYANLQTTTKDAQLNLYNTLPFYSPQRDLSIFEPIVCGDPVSRDMNVVQQLKAVEKSRREIEEFLSDFGNWAWVYETPSPFESKVYGIDELLLPEEDPRYEQFEDIIFDKETMTPRDPIKILSPTSFLAKYPIEMPVEEYADVGVFYDDSAQKWEQYFGIETDVMKDIYLKYYQIWQAKIFEFSTMTMVQSTKKMLEYLYTWIDMYYPVDKMQQALRVFRQIRWYSESAVIRNSQYIISYEYDTLKSDLHTGVCHVPNDLDTITNPTMYVDKKFAVIRNDKAFLGQDAHVTFEIDAPKNTYIKFDLFTEYGKGTAMVYLNDTLVRVCTSAALGVIIQLPYTGSINRVTIIKTGTNNVGEFYVGNVSVPNATFKNLSIEFDPVLRAGNKPLEEVAKKMIACANLYADKNEMYAVIKKSSLGFSETYRQMNDYWKLHHQDKAKGKRLTIKQT